MFWVETIKFGSLIGVRTLLSSFIIFLPFLHFVKLKECLVVAASYQTQVHLQYRGVQDKCTSSDCPSWAYRYTFGTSVLKLGMYIRAKWVYCSSDVLIFFLVAWIVFVCPSLYMWVWNFLAIDASPLLYRVWYTVLPQHSSIPQQKEAFPEDGLYSPFCVQPCSIFWKHFATSLAVHNLTVINAWVLLVGGLAKLLLWDLVFAGGCGLTGDWSERHDKQHFWHLGRGQHHGLQCFQTACCYAMCKNLGCIPFVHLKLLRELHWYLSCWRYFKGKRCAKELWFRG